MNALDRIRAARQTTSPSAEPNSPPRAEAVTPPPPSAPRSPLEPALLPAPSSLPRAQAAPSESENWRSAQQQLAALRTAIEQSHRETNRTLCLVAITCILAGASTGPLVRALAPTRSNESRRLEELGATVEERYRAMTEKQRNQVDKLMGWTREIGRRER